eukprot:6792929-Pyramimonas_sp.AAC.1
MNVKGFPSAPLALYLVRTGISLGLNLKRVSCSWTALELHLNYNCHASTRFELRSDYARSTLQLHSNYTRAAFELHVNYVRATLELQGQPSTAADLHLRCKRTAESPLGLPWHLN